MPRRPRQHQLEDESRTAFRAALPPAWVFRDAVPDYGIDGAVEIFDATGKGTGRLFFVQLKATDEADSEAALSVRLPLDTGEYYRSLDIPVLIVRYLAATRTLYARWFHTFDPYYGKAGRKTITFSFASEDKWSGETPERLSADLEAIRLIKSPQLPLPIPFRLVLRDAQVHGVPTAQIGFAIRELARRVASVIELDAHGRALGSIVIGNDKSIVDLGVSSFTLHTSRGYSSEYLLSKFPSDLLLSLALALDHRGHSNVAARLIAEYAANASLFSIPEVALRVARCMARANRVTEALQLSETLLRGESNRFAADTLMLVGLLRSDFLTASESEYYQRVLLGRIENARTKDERQDAAAGYYNYGNFLRGRMDRLAVHHYKMASRYDPTYWERAYFCRELAGLLFGNGRYRASANLYSRAIALGDEAISRPLCADALMFSGRYREAQERFDSHIASAASDLAEWRLKSWALNRIRGMLGSDEQRREVRASMELAAWRSKDSLVERKRGVTEALRRDALCGLAWFNSGVNDIEAGERDEALAAFLLAALIQRNDVEAWANVIMLGLQSERYGELMPDVVETAYWTNGERLSAQMVKAAEQQPKGFDAPGFLQVFSNLFAAVPKRERRIQVRLLKEGSQYEEITLGETKGDCGHSV